MRENIIKSFDGEEIWYRITGEGKHTLLLADGIACTGYVWDYIIPYFKDYFRIIHFNYRGHGKTPAPKSYDNVTVLASVKDMNAILEHENIDNVILLGHSMGVQVIYEFYNQYRKKVEALIPMCGSYGHPMQSYHNTNKFEPIFRMLVNFVFKPYSSVTKNVQKFLVHNSIAYWFVANTEINGKMVKKSDFMAYLEEISNHLDLKSFGYMLDSAMEHSALNVLPEIDIPVLIIAGKKDKMTPAFLSTKMYKLIPNSKLEVLEWGSHTAPIEQPEMTNLLVEDFLVDNGFM